jgi:hypothetical protein
MTKRQDISDDGIELQATTQIRVEAVEKSLNSKYINSLLVKETHDPIFPKKKTSNIPIDNGSSLNIPITIKIIALTNITLIETSVLVV